MAMSGVRAQELIQEELAELRRYLEGIPGEIKAGGAFAAYERRAAELTRELIMAQLFRFYQVLPYIPPHELATAFTKNTSRSLEKTLQHLEREYKRSGDRYVREARVLHWGVFASSAAGAISSFSGLVPLTIPFAVGSAGLAAALAFLGLTGKARKHQRVADQIAALRNVIVHSFGASGEILDPADYYQANREQIEVLIEEILRSTSGKRLDSLARVPT